jgi:hypothetical protein
MYFPVMYPLETQIVDLWSMIITVSHALVQRTAHSMAATVPNSGQEQFSFPCHIASQAYMQQ